MSHVSCGGIITKINQQGQREILLLHRKPKDDWPYDSWHLPKGTQEQNETDEETVHREVQEETGWQVTVGKKIGSLRSHYERDGKRIKKTTRYYACLPLGRIGTPDHEHDAVCWLPIADACRKLQESAPFEDEYQIVQRFLK
ncbi:MAG TPA: NUDIX domain-containing protein [bacterium]|nr:NUDIX domain-containing protein [bacterium]